MEALKNGDRAEFARLVDAYSAPIYRLALKIVGNPQDAEDVLQETFIEAFMALRRRKPDTVSVDAEVETPDGEQAPVEIVDWCCLPEDELLSAEAREYLDHAIDGLAPTLRVVFLLRDIDGFSVHETAEALNISEAAVKTRLLRARLQLRERLSHYYDERMKEAA